MARGVRHESRNVPGIMANKRTRFTVAPGLTVSAEYGREPRQAIYYTFTKDGVGLSNEQAAEHLGVSLATLKSTFNAVIEAKRTREMAAAYTESAMALLAGMPSSDPRTASALRRVALGVAR